MSRQRQRWLEEAVSSDVAKMPHALLVTELEHLEFPMAATKADLREGVREDA